MIWRREYKGHVPDTAIAAINSSRRGKETSYFGRAALSKEVVVPGEHSSGLPFYCLEQILMTHWSLFCTSLIVIGRE